MAPSEFAGSPRAAVNSLGLMLVLLLVAATAAVRVVDNGDGKNGLNVFPLPLLPTRIWVVAMGMCRSRDIALG